MLGSPASHIVIDRTFRRFLVVGLANTVLGLLVIFAARQVVTDLWANMIGYLVVVPVSFLTHRTLSFQDKGNRLGAFLRYLPTVAAGYVANLATLSAALSAGANPYLAQTLAIASHVIVTYILTRFFVFLNPDAP